MSNSPVTIRSVVLAALLLAGLRDLAQAQGTAFTYQGRLNDSGAPVNGTNDLTFTVYDAVNGGAPVGASNVVNDLVIHDGLFTVTVDFGVGVFNGNARWLEIGVRPGNSVGAYTALTPRQPITATPYAVTAGTLTGTVPSGGLAGTYSAAVSLNNAANTLAGNGSGLTGLNAGNLTSGTVSDSRLSANVARLDGTPTFAGTVASLGDLAGARLYIGTGHNLDGSFSSIAGGQFNILSADYAFIGGGSGNTNFGFYSTIGGGHGNDLDANYSFIGGGDLNTVTGLRSVVVGGELNTASGSRSTVVGGTLNTADGSRSTVAGGENNRVSGDRATITGGKDNLAFGFFSTISGGGTNLSGTWATVGGGQGNSAGGDFSAIPGGRQNVATNYGFAAGRRAKAMHDGAFVWADAQDADFSSTTTNQFNVRASGGARFETDGSGMMLNGQSVLAGTVPSSALSGTYSNPLTLNNAANNFVGSFTGNGAGLTNLAGANLPANVALLSTNQTFTGANTFSSAGNSFTGSFTGNGAGLTNLTGVASTASLLSVSNFLWGRDTKVIQWINDPWLSLSNNPPDFAGQLGIAYAPGGTTFIGIGDGNGEWFTADLNFSQGISTIGDTRRMPAHRAQELQIIVNGTADKQDPDTLGSYGDNVIALRNMRTKSHSAARFVDANGDERGAVGFGNINASFYPAVNYLEDYYYGQGFYYVTAGTLLGGLEKTTGDFVWLPTGMTNAAQAATQAVFRVTSAGNVTGGQFTGNGAGVTNLSAANLASGTLPSARLSGTYSSALTLNNAANNFVGSFTGNGGGLTNVPGANLPANVALVNTNQTFTGANIFSSAGNSFTGNGAGLTALNASQLASGTVADARLSANVALLNANETFTGTNTFNSAGNSFTGNGAGLSALNASQLSSGTVPSARLSGTYSSALTLNNAGNSFTGNGAGLTGISAAALAPGSISNSLLADGAVSANKIASGQAVKNLNGLTDGVTLAAGANVVLSTNGNTLSISATGGGGGGSSSNAWAITGNVGTTAGVNFLGTVDNTPLEVKVNAARALRLEPTASGYPNIIGGLSNSVVTAGTAGATIGGGYSNTAAGQTPVIGGGSGNTANGLFATVPGGTLNAATNYGFAAGRRAQAIHDGAFVWADAQDADFSSTTTNQFNVRASGGARFETDGSGMTLNGQSVLAGTVPSAALSGTYSNPLTLNNAGNNFTGSGAGLTSLSAANLSSGTVADARLSANVALLNANETFTGTNTFNSAGNSFTGNGAGLSALNASQLSSGTVPSARLSGTYSSAVTLNNAGNSFTGNGAGLTGISAAALAPGSISNSLLADGAVSANKIASGQAVKNLNGLTDGVTLAAGANVVLSTNGNTLSISATGGGGGGSSSNAWAITGNVGTTAGVNFLGTVDNTPLEVKVNAARALRLEPTTSGYPNIIGGLSNSVVTAGTAGATIGGGYSNTAAGQAPVIGGGSGNTVNGLFATVPGGTLNAATNYAFAAGRRAQAIHDGAFVWADAQDADFSSTTTNQFNVRASGGARFETDGSGMTLNGQSVLAGTVPSAALSGTYSNPLTLNSAANNFVGSFSGNGAGLTNVPGANLPANVALLNTNQTFTGTNIFSSVGNSFTGNGAGLTALNASQLASGTVADARLSANVALLNGNQTFTSTNTFSSAGNSFAGNGAGLTALNASQLSSGTVPSGRLSGTYSNAVTLNNAGNSFTGNGAGLTALNASQLSSGTAPNGRLSGTYSNPLTLNNAANNFVGSFTGNGAGLTNLAGANLPANVALLNTNQTFTGTNTFTGGLSLTSVVPTITMRDLDGGGTATISVSGVNPNVNISGKLVANGEFITALDAGNLASGTVPSARLSANVALLNGNQTFIGANNFNNASNTFVGNFTGSGAGLTTLNASQLASGTIPSAQLSGTYASAVTLNNAANSFSGSGAGLTGLSAANVSSGTLADARLSANVALLDANQAFGGANSFGSTSNSFTGNGAGLTGLNAANLSSGTIPGARLSGTYSSALTLNNAANSFNGSGAGLTALNASSLSSGTVADARLSANVALLNATQTLTGANTFNNAGNSFSGSGAGLTGLSAANVASGTLADARLSANVALLNANETFTGANAFNSAGNTFVGAFTGNGAGLTNLNVPGLSTNTALLNARQTFTGTNTFRIGNAAPALLITNTSDNPTAIEFSQANMRWRIGQNRPSGAANTQDAFYIQDVDSGLTRFIIQPSGNVGIGTDTPVSDLHVPGTITCGIVSNLALFASGDLSAQRLNVGTSGTISGTNSTIAGGLSNNITGFMATIPGGQLNQATNYAFAAGRRAKANHQGAFVWGDSTDADIASAANNSVTMRAGGGYRLFSNTNATAGVSLATGATSWGTISDRNAKKNFQPVDVKAVLEKLTLVPVQRWNYKWESDGEVPHLGPMAQDFKAAFYPGRDNKVITTLEMEGVALAAIQGLNEKLEVRSQKLEAENAELKARLERLERLVNEKNGGAK